MLFEIYYINNMYLYNMKIVQRIQLTLGDTGSKCIIILLCYLINIYNQIIYYVIYNI